MCLKPVTKGSRKSVTFFTFIDITGKIQRLIPLKRFSILGTLSFSLIREKVILGRGEICLLYLCFYFLFFFLRLEYTRQEGTKRKDSYVDGPSPEFKVEMTLENIHTVEQKRLL